jgi:hypothetical protein
MARRASTGDLGKMPKSIFNTMPPLESIYKTRIINGNRKVSFEQKPPQKPPLQQKYTFSPTYFQRISYFKQFNKPRPTQIDPILLLWDFALTFRGEYKNIRDTSTKNKKGPPLNSEKEFNMNCFSYWTPMFASHVRTVIQDLKQKSPSSFIKTLLQPLEVVSPLSRLYVPFVKLLRYQIYRSQPRHFMINNQQFYIDEETIKSSHTTIFLSYLLTLDPPTELNPREWKTLQTNRNKSISHALIVIQRQFRTLYTLKEKDLFD